MITGQQLAPQRDDELIDSLDPITFDVLTLGHTIGMANGSAEAPCNWFTITICDHERRGAASSWGGPVAAVRAAQGIPLNHILHARCTRQTVQVEGIPQQDPALATALFHQSV